MASNLQGLSDRLQTAPNNGPDPVVERLDEMTQLGRDIKKLLSSTGAGKGKEPQLNKIKDSTSPLSITRVDGESAGKILSAATDNLSKDLEKFSEAEHKMMTDLVTEIGKLTEKNLEGFNKGIKEVVDLAKKGQALAEKSGNVDGAKRFGDTAKAAKDEHFRVNKMDLRGDKDTFANRFSRALGNKEPIDTKKTGVRAFGTALRQGAKGAMKEFAKGVLKGKEGSFRDQIFTSDKAKRSAEREKQGWAPEAEKMVDLTEDQKKMLAQKGIAPASEKDISYRKAGKPVSLKDINAEIEKDYDDRNNKTAIVPDKPAAAEIASPVTDTGSDMQEVSAGLADSPVVDAIEEQTEVIKGISDTSKQTLELIDAINKSMQKIADSIDNIGGESGGGDSGGLPSIDIDLPSRKRGGSLDAPDNRKQSKSDRARSQPRDAKGRFVKRTPDLPAGRKPGKGRGILGALAAGAGAIGLGAMVASDDTESSSANISTNAAMTATDLVDAGGSGAKNEAKAAEKGAAKAGEKAATKAGEKAATKAGQKGAVKAGEKVASKGVAKVGAKAVGKSLLKKIPGVGLVAGGVFAAQRAMAGDWTGAGLELASGAAGTIPGVGTAASVGLDAALAARDMGALGGTPETRAAEAAQAPKATSQSKPAAVQGKPGGGIFSRAAGFVKKNPLMAAAGLGGVGLAAVGASKAWDWMSGGDEKKVESGQNPDSGILEQGTEKAKDQMKVNVPPPTIINQGGGGGAKPESTTVPNTKSYVRDDESSWMRFALKRAMA
jgi:hypothetical protein